MIIGEYPCCGGNLAVPLAEGNLPRYQREECPHCGEVVWHVHSRIDPKTHTDAAFRELYVVDDMNRTITPVSKES